MGDGTMSKNCLSSKNLILRMQFLSSLLAPILLLPSWGFWVVTLDGPPFQAPSLARGAFLFVYSGLSPKQGLRFVAPLTCLGATLEAGEVFLRMWSIPGGRCIRAFPLTSGSTNAAVKKGSMDYSTYVPWILLSNKKKQATDACNDSTHAPGIFAEWKIASNPQRLYTK